ncbi:MAG: Asp-tRNA(Asn)/Glu-tRNA(Gln) amidotransferase A subunit family amidase, partial [Kiritimatiellia bacterium]
PPLLIAMFEQINDMVPVFSMDKLTAEGHALRESLADLLGETGVLLLPTMPRPSPRHHGFMLRPWDTGGCGIFNVTELPATTVPVGLSEGGLPLGVQVVGAHRNDLLTLRVAGWIEDELGGWIRADPA